MIAHFKLYKACKIIPEKSFIVDSLTDYLATLSYLEDNINYFKFDKKEPTLKLEMSQERAEMLNANDYNYIEIQNEGLSAGSTRKYYYFVTNKVWKSENCIELQLYMDTVNTFTYNTDYIISNKTKVLREHKDRYKYITPTKTYMEGSTSVRVNTPLPIGYRGEISLPANPELIGLSDPTIVVNAEEEGVTAVGLLDSTTGVLTIYAQAEYQASYNVFYSVSASYTPIIVKNVDSFPEGINPQLFKGQDQEINQEFNSSWNLIYKNRDNIEPSEYNQVNPIECFLCADDIHKAKSSSSTSISYSDLTEGMYYYIAPSNNEGNELKFKDNQGYIYDLNLIRRSAGEYYTDITQWIVLYRATGNAYFTIYLHTYNKSYDSREVYYFKEEVSYTGTNITTLDIMEDYSNIYYALSNADNIPAFSETQTSSFSFTLQDRNMLSLASVDRTDSKLIKIIKLPYSPTKYSINLNNELIFNTSWRFDTTTGFFKLNDLNTKFNYAFNTTFKDPLDTLLKYPTTRNLTQSRNIEYETKLLNSEFYYPKFVYDSFGFDFNLERVDINKYRMNRDSEYFKLGFVMTTTINSKFMFYFPNYELLDFLKTQDYDNVLPISRNNEVALYNNQYINYLRTGYNYDLKNKNRAETTSGISTAMGIIGAVASVGLGVASGNPAIAVSGLIGGISSATASIMSNVNTIASAENNMASKIEQLKAQSTNVTGSDDIDLLEAYSNNRAKLTTYRVSDRMRQALFDLFYYCGYSTNEMKAPNLNTRGWFNYVQAELEINASNNLPDFVTKDLIDRFKLGVTVLHKNVISGTNTWDFNQEKENWEVTLLS